MPDNKKHHFVPKFYLRFFSNDGLSINLFNIPRSKKIISSGLKNQCYRDYFYGKNLEGEKALGKIEGIVAEIIKNIVITKEIPALTSADRTSLLLYIMVQYSRTGYRADALDEMADAFFKYAFQEKFKELDADSFKIGFKEPGTFSVAMGMQTYELLIDMEWLLVETNGRQEFITSDAPVVFYNQFFDSRREGSNTGAATKGLQIFFPLSPDLLLVLYDGNVYRAETKPKNSLVARNLPDTDILEINKLQFVSAYENIYFCNNGFDVERLSRLGIKYRRSRKNSQKVFPQWENEERRSELIMTSNEDVRTDLALSFLKVKKSATRWLGEFMKLKSRPAVVQRDDELMRAHQAFGKLVKEGVYSYGDFFEFLRKESERVRQHQEVERLFGFLKKG